MSGHSKWQNIRIKKGAEDKKRALVFTKAARLITAAVSEGKSADSEKNPNLRTAIERARAVNMPKDNINRAVARGQARLGIGGVGEGSAFLEVLYEGYGVDGVAMMINAVTDNKNRTAADIKGLLKKFGGGLGEPGSASYVFSEGSPSFKVPVENKSRFNALLEELNALEDVQKVVHNAKL